MAKSASYFKYTCLPYFRVKFQLIICETLDARLADVVMDTGTITLTYLITYWTTYWCFNSPHERACVLALLVCPAHSAHFLRVHWSFNPFDAHCCHMGTAIKHHVPDRVKPSFVIFDIWAL